MGKGLGASPMHPPPNLALQSSPKSTITQPAVQEYMLTTQQKVMNTPPVTIICFEI